MSDNAVAVSLNISFTQSVEAEHPEDQMAEALQIVTALIHEQFPSARYNFFQLEPGAAEYE